MKGDDRPMPANAIFIHHPGAARYKFNEQHPFNPQRLTLAIDLLQEVDALRGGDVIAASPASENLLSLVHRSDYLEAVKQLSLDPPPEEWVRQAQRYGLQTEDTPFFPGMHEAASAIVGAGFCTDAPA